MLSLKLIIRETAQWLYTSHSTVPVVLFSCFTVFLSSLAFSLRVWFPFFLLFCSQSFVKGCNVQRFVRTVVQNKDEDKKNKINKKNYLLRIPLLSPHSVIYLICYEICFWYLRRQRVKDIKYGHKGDFFRSPVLKSAGELHPTGIGATSSGRSVGVRGCSDSRFGL